MDRQPVTATRRIPLSDTALFALAIMFWFAAPVLGIVLQTA